MSNNNNGCVAMDYQSKANNNFNNENIDSYSSLVNNGFSNNHNNEQPKHSPDRVLGLEEMGYQKPKYGMSNNPSSINHQHDMSRVSSNNNQQV